MGSYHFFRIGGARHFIFDVQIDIDEYQRMHDRLPPKGVFSGSCDLFVCLYYVK